MSDTRVRVLLSRFQNAFFKELAGVIVDEIERLGGTAEVVSDRVMADSSDVFVLLPTHEYLALEGHSHIADVHRARRTIGITAEQPTSSHFTQNVKAGRVLGAVFDFSDYAVRAYRNFGVDAHQLPFGWTPSWDRFNADLDRDGPDVLFLGCTTERRSRLLSIASRAIWQRHSRIILSDNSRPNHEGSASFVAGEEKRELLASSKILLNLHQTDEPYFEWLRVSEAILCGALVLSEPSIFMEPFVDGTHLVVRTAGSLASSIDELLANPDHMRTIRVNAYEELCARPFSRSVERLLEIAHDLRRNTVPIRGEVGPSRLTPFGHEPVSATRTRDREKADVLRQALRELRLDVMDIRRQLQAGRVEHAKAHAEPEVILESAAEALAQGPTRLSVLVAVYNHDAYLTDALTSAANSGFEDLEIVIVDDGSTDDSLDVARSWVMANPDVRVRVVAVPVNRGLPRARNTALRHACGEICFVLDADNEVLPGGIDKLVAALDADPAASFAYGLLETFDAHGSVGLLGQFPWDTDRLAHGNYIDAMAVIRTPVLREIGGYTTDRRLYGWEDYDVWCRVAERGGYGVHVPTIVAKYRLAMSSMVSLSNLSHDAAFDALYEHAPQLMSRASRSRSGDKQDSEGNS